MIPITSSAGWVLLYSLCRRTISPLLTTASGSPVQVDIFSTLCTSVGSRVATDRQIEAPPRLSLVASTAIPWPCTCPSMATTLPGTFTFQSRWVSENPAGMEYSESPHWSMSSHTGLSRATDSQDGRMVEVTCTYTVLEVAEWFIRSTSRFQES